MPNRVRFRWLSEIAEDVRTRLAAVEPVGGGDPVLQSVVRLTGTKIEDVAMAVERTTAVPAAIIMPMHGKFEGANGAAPNSRETVLTVFVVTEEYRLQEDNHFAELSDLAELLMEAYLPQVDSQASKYEENGVRYRPSDWQAGAFPGCQYDVYRFDLAAWDCRTNRDDDGVPV